MGAYVVSRRVNSVKNDDEERIEPVRTQQGKRKHDDETDSVLRRTCARRGRATRHFPPYRLGDAHRGWPFWSP
jgi:hypothetical protein